MKRTDVDARILAFIASYFARTKEWPSLEAIGEAVGYKSKSTTHKYIQRLIAAGKLEKSVVSRRVKLP